MSDTELNCIDCKNCKLPFVDYIKDLLGIEEADLNSFRCQRKINRVINDRVRGKRVQKIRTNSLCSSERSYDSTDYCGHTGRHWIPKRRKDLFKVLTKE